MPYNGAGDFSPPAGDFPAVTLTVISSSKYNSVINDIAGGLDDCVTRDGQSPATNNLPMGGFKHTQVANATLVDQYATYGQLIGALQAQGFNWCGTAGGTATSITLTPVPAIAAYAAGQQFSFIVNAATTGPATISVSGLAVKSLNKGNGTLDLGPNDLLAGELAVAQYDGTRFQLLNEKTYAKAVDVPGASSINLNTISGDFVHLTGTTGIAAIVLFEGQERITVTDGILTFTNGASLILITGANITSAAGDIQRWRGEAGGVVRMVSYHRANGKALAITPMTLPTRQVFTTGSGTYTTPAGCTSVNVKLIGAGGGGSGNSGAAGTVGGNTTFSTLTGNGGAGATGGGVAGGAGGTASGGDVNIAGGSGGAGGTSPAGTVMPGGNGGNGVFGGGGGGGLTGTANSGGGGGGGTGSAGTNSGGGGGSGGYAEKRINSPAATYSYAVGAGGGGSSGSPNAGVAGGSGIIIVDEFYFV